MSPTRLPRWAQIIDMAMTNANLSNAQIARKIGVSHQFLSAIRNGRNRPSDKLLSRLLSILNSEQALSEIQQIQLIDAIINDAMQKLYKKSRSKRHQINKSRKISPYTSLQAMLNQQNANLFYPEPAFDKQSIKNLLEILPKSDIKLLRRFCSLLLNSTEDDTIAVLAIYETMINRQLKRLMPR